MNFNFVSKPAEDISDYDSIMRALAEKQILMPMNREVHGPIENFLEATIDLAKREKADCCIMTGHVACKSNWAAMKLIKDTVEEELGIPMLVFEVDLFDPRIINPDGVRDKLSDFSKRLLSRIRTVRKNAFCQYQHLGDYYPLRSMLQDIY